MSINKKEEKTLTKHKKHHSKKHMRRMRLLMKEGLSFSKAHTQAMKKVGK